MTVGISVGAGPGLCGERGCRVSGSWGFIVEEKDGFCYNSSQQILGGNKKWLEGNER
ncbi:MAG: hypothetical protein MSH32_08910 [Lachnospiraceae bacterium]|nr:hypothetical protein [Lachnospiraceae bacterium]